MPSTYTTNGGIELIATGEQSGTWGDTTNDNLQIIDRLTNGVGSISLSGTTHTLTTSDGALSDGQYAVLVFGGTPSGTNTVTISPNTNQHVYIVKNNSGQSVVLTQGSGGNVTVANGKSAIVYASGGGAGAAVVDVTNTFNFQPLDAELTAIAALATTDGNFIVGNGSTWVAESGSTARTSLGLGTIATQAANNVSITGGSITGITDLAVADGGTGVSTVPTNGQLLIGNGSGYTVATLTAGTGASISNGAGTITISATGSGGTVTNVATGTGLTGGPITSTGTISVATNGITDTLLRDSAALSVIGRSANSTGDPADIAASSDHQVLRRSGTSLGFGAINLASTSAVTGDLPFSNLAQGSALSVLGVTGNATADVASIAAGTDHQVLRRSGSSVAFGSVALNQSAAVTGTLPVSNGGTGATTLTANNVLLGNGTSALQVVAPGTSGNVLTSNGTTWTSAAPAGGGAWELISSSSMFGSTTYVDISLPTDYKVYKLYVRALDPNGSRKLYAYLFSGSVGSPSFYSACSYNYASWLGGTLTDGDVIQASGYAEIVSQDVLADDGDGGSWGEILIIRPDSINNVQLYLQSHIGFTTQGTPERIGGQQITTATYYNNATTVPEMVGIRLAYEASGFINGSYYLVGLSI